MKIRLAMLSLPPDLPMMAQNSRTRDAGGGRLATERKNSRSLALTGSA
jgi:hypothetical protein